VIEFSYLLSLYLVTVCSNKDVLNTANVVLGVNVEFVAR